MLPSFSYVLTPLPLLLFLHLLSLHKSYIMVNSSAFVISHQPHTTPCPLHERQRSEERERERGESGMISHEEKKHNLWFFMFYFQIVTVTHMHTLCTLYACVTYCDADTGWLWLLSWFCNENGAWRWQLFMLTSLITPMPPCREKQSTQCLWNCTQSQRKCWIIIIL